jgi:thiol-disulfide isomerase/thioredoxin
MRRLVVSLVLAWSLVASSAWAYKTGDVFPAVPLKGLSSGTFDKDYLKDKVTVINFWATWCAACKIELVEMVEKFEALTTNPAFQLAFISVDKDAKKAQAWVRGSGVKDADKVLKSVFIDSEFKTAEKLELESFPMTFIVGKDGKILEVVNGFKEGKGQTEALVKKVQTFL